MNWDEVERQQPMAAVNIVINKFTEHQAVEHSFLVRHWHQVESVRWLAEMQYREGCSVEAVARNIANEAVKSGVLHRSLVEHAVLYARWQINASDT